MMHIIRVRECNEDLDDEPGNMDDPIRFQKFSLMIYELAHLEVVIPYYSAGIYLDVCIKYGDLDVNRTAKDEHPRCNGLVVVTIPFQKDDRVVKIRESVQKFKFSF